MDIKKQKAQQVIDVDEETNALASVVEFSFSAVWEQAHYFARSARIKKEDREWIPLNELFALVARVATEYGLEKSEVLDELSGHLDELDNDVDDDVSNVVAIHAEVPPAPPSVPIPSSAMSDDDEVDPHTDSPPSGV